MELITNPDAAEFYERMGVSEHRYKEILVSMTVELPYVVLDYMKKSGDVDVIADFVGKKVETVNEFAVVYAHVLDKIVNMDERLVASMMHGASMTKEQREASVNNVLKHHPQYKDGNYKP